MKKYSEFITAVNESSGKNYIDVFDEDKPFGEPVDKVHKNDLMTELEELLLGKENGYVSRVTVFADVPEQGSRRPSYLADVLPSIKRQRTPDPIDRPADDEPDDVNVFVDVEFEVVSLDKENNKIVAMPYSLRRKNITTPLDPRDVLEISFKRNRSKGGA